MHAFRQLLFNHFATSGTHLACPSGVYFDNLSPSVFSFGFEDIEESPPRRIRDAFGEVSVTHHTLDIKFLYRYAVVFLDESVRKFMSKIKPFIGNSFVHTGEEAPCFLSAVRPFLTPRKALLCLFEFPFAPAEELPDIYGSTIACGEEGVKPHIKPDSDISRGQRIRRTFNDERYMPTAIPVRNGEGLDRTVNRSMPLDLDVAHTLEVKPRAGDPATIAMSGVLDRIEPVGGFESRITRLLPCLDAAKERLERFVKSPQGLLKRTVIAESNRFVGSPESSQKPCCLFGIADRFAKQLESFLTLLQRLIIQIAVSAKLFHERLGLLLCGIQPVFVGLDHLSLFLLFDKLFDRLFGNLTHATDIIRSAPQGREARPQSFIFLSKKPGSISLELIGEPLRCFCRVRRNKQMNVVRHYLKRFYNHVKLICLFIKQKFQVFGYVSRKDRSPIFGAPHKMIFQGINTAMTFSVPNICHKNIIRYYLLVVNYITLNEVRCPHSPGA